MKTKQELIEEIAGVKIKNDSYQNKDERLRKEFAKAFSWYTQRPYGGDREVQLPSWEQIFVNLGTLLAAKNFMDFEGNLSELEVKLENLEQKIRKEIHPNL